MFKTVVLDPPWLERGGGKKRSKGPFLEVFARRERENWTCWGNEV
jgi:N6-adenosine-specific RNA methylase IME4